MVHAGEDIYTQKCLQCHSHNQGQVSFGPNLYGEMKAPHSKSAAEIRGILKNGKGKMPPFDGKLTPVETDNLLAYLRTL
jgi:mono/diheme cytochrome c family protein